MDPQAIERAANSNISFGFAVISILFFLFGIVVGEHLAEELGRRCDGRRQYYLANVAWLMGGVVLSTLVFATGWVAFAAVTIGGIAGGLAGLKFGFGESVGPWKFVDKAFSANKGQVAAAKDPERARQRRKRDLARRRGEKVDEPELMSVAPQHEDASGEKRH